MDTLSRIHLGIHRWSLRRLRSVRPRTLLGLLLALAVLGASGCVRSYRRAPPLPFAEFDYSGLDGKPWPTKRVPLPRTAAAHQLATVPEVAVVELNPSGERTVLFLHGLGSYLKFWRAQLDLFAAQGYRVLAVDLPGFGKSDKPATFPYSTEAMAEAVLELAQHFQVKRPILIGHSMGGQVALSFAIQYPQVAEALVLTSPAGFEKFTAREKAWYRKAFSATLVKSTPEYGIWGTVRQANFSRWRPELEWLIEERVRVVGTADFDAYAYAQVRAVEGLTHDDFVRDNLKAIQTPALIIFGEEDRLIPNPFMHGGVARTVMAYGHGQLQGSKLVGLARCGHTVQLDCPEDYNRHVLEFLNALPATKQSAATGAASR